MALTLSDATAIAGANAMVDRVDAGAAAGHIKVYDSTTTPGTPDPTKVLLDFTLNDPAFGDAALVGNDILAALQGTPKSANGQTSAGNQQASWFSAQDSNGVQHLWGTCGVQGSGADLELQSLTIVNGVQTTIDSGNFKLPRFTGD